MLTFKDGKIVKLDPFVSITGCRTTGITPRPSMIRATVPIVETDWTDKSTRICEVAPVIPVRNNRPLDPISWTGESERAR